MYRHGYVEFDNIYVWNADSEISDWIKDDEIKAYTLKLLKSNQRIGKPIFGIGVVTLKGHQPYQKLTESQQNRIDDLRKILFLCAVAESNVRGQGDGHGMVTAENFIVIRQNFILNDKYTGFSAGKIIQTSDFGYKLDEIKYEAPRYIMTGPLSIDEKLLDMLKKCKRKNRKLYRTILRATDAMMNGYQNSDNVSYESRILEQARAFEILFNLPERQQRKVFKEKIVFYCQPNNARTIWYKYERLTKAGLNFVKEKGTKHKMWADRFYVLKNHIIHGEKNKRSDFIFYGQRHHDLGLWFFIVAVKQLLNEDFGKKYFYDCITIVENKFEYDSGLLRKAFEMALKQTTP